MTPRERLVQALRGEGVDYLPCTIYFNGNLSVGRFDCSRVEDRLELARELGVDTFAGVRMPVSIHPKVCTEVLEEEVAGEPYPILRQTWRTPDGPLTQAIRKGPACAGWQAIKWGDESAGSIYKPLVESPEDAVRCRHLLQPATEDDYERWVRTNRTTFDLADRYGMPVVATYGQGLAWLLFTMGAERAVYFAMDHPESFEELAEAIHRAERRAIELAGRGHVDVLKRFGAYEMCNFFNPDIYRRVCVPRLQREAALARQVGLPAFYRVVTGMEPLLEDIAGLGFDGIEGGEPHLSDCSLERWRDAFAGRAASWAGVSTPVLLGGRDAEAVRREVRRCVDVFGRRGYVLGVTNSIRNHFPWENTVAMVDEWKRVR